jgi:hypothetical protein
MPWHKAPRASLDGFSRPGAPSALHVAQFIVASRLRKEFARIQLDLKNRWIRAYVNATFAANPTLKRIVFFVTCRPGRRRRYTLWASVPCTPGARITTVRGNIYGRALMTSVRGYKFSGFRKPSYRCLTHCDDAMIRHAVAIGMGLPVP